MLILKHIIFFSMLVSSTYGFALFDWTVNPQSYMDPKNLRKMKSKWSKIRNTTDLENLIDEISRNGTYSHIEANLVGTNKIQINLKRALRIYRISIHSTTREIKVNLQALMHPYKHQVDSLEVRKRIENDIKAYLRNIGFLKASIKVTSFPREDETKLIVKVDEDFPCLIRDIQLGFTLPSDAKLPISIGDICDMNVIQNSIRLFKENLLASGYNQHKILNPEIRFDPPSNSALILINGTIGKKIRSKVTSIHSNAPFLSYLIGDELHTLDPTITDPNTMRTEIFKKFKNRGYQDVKVSPYRKLHPSKNEIIYEFEVEPGPAYEITEVLIEGLKSISTSEATEIMGLEASLLDNYPKLTDSSIRSAMDLLNNKYSNQGFWDVKISYPKIKKNPKTAEASLAFTVREGKKRILEGITFRGHRAFSDSELSNFFPLSKNDPLTWKVIVDLQQDIQKEYRNIGYLYAKVKIDLLQNRRFRDIPTRLSITIDEGPRVKIGKITFKGLVKTDPEVIRRELFFKEGDWYSPSSIDDSRQALIDLGLFSSISISATNTSDFSEEKLVIPYTLSMRESKPGQVSFGPGWSYQDGGRFSMDASYNNIEGTARKIFLNASYSEEYRQSPIDEKRLLGYNLGLGYIEPYVLGIPVDGILTISQSAEANDKTWELTKAIQTTLASDYIIHGNKFKSEIFGLYKITQEKAPERVSDILNTDEIEIRESGIRGILDTRKDIRWPTGGAVLSGESSWADYVLGGDTKYFHWTFKSSNYFQFSQNLVLASKLSLESYSNVNRLGTTFNFLPASELLQSGGPETNRGFKFGDLGPVVRYPSTSEGEIDKLNIGGSQAFALALELRYKVASSFGLTTFIDASNTFITQEEVSAIEQRISQMSGENGAEDLTGAELLDNVNYEFSDLWQDPSLIIKNNYLSYGLSANYLTPLGSINMSYGFPIQRCTIARPCSAPNTIPRGNSQFRKIRGGQLQLNVGTNF